MSDQQRTKDLSTDQVIDKLRQVQSVYDGGPLPEWLETNTWGEELSKLAGDAADLIEWYQYGKMPDHVNIISSDWEEHSGDIPGRIDR